MPRPKQRRTRSGELVGQLEPRTLLAVTAGEYATIRSTYANFGLPADMAQVNIIEITPDQLSVAALKTAITAAGTTTLPDLVVLRTTNTQNTITYSSSADQLAISIPSTKGAISIVGLGPRPVTLNAAGLCRVLSVGGTSSTTTVNLGAMVLTGGNAAGTGGGISQSYGTLRLTNTMICGNSSGPSSSGGGIYQYRGTSVLTNVVIGGNGSTGSGGGAYLTSGTSTFTDVTISGNTAEGSGGGIYQSSNTTTLNNTIIARNAGGLHPDLSNSSGAFSGANNLIGDGTGQGNLVNGVNGNLVGSSTNPIDPLLAEGTIYGIGLSPLPGSPAIDAGDSSLVPVGITTDVYGAARIQGAKVNIGAVERTLPGTAAVAYVVTSLADDVAVDGVMTFREALLAANTNLAAGDAPAGSYSSADRIQFAPGLSGMITANGKPYAISSSMVLEGPGMEQLTLDAGSSSSVVDVRGRYDVSISGMTITGGKAANGGGIYNLGARLQLDHVAISRNTATSNGAGIYQQYGTLMLTSTVIVANTAPSGVGGGIYMSGGTLALASVAIASNRAAESGGGLCLSGVASTFANVTISRNLSTSNYGGGVYLSSGSLTLNNTIIARNIALRYADLDPYGVLPSGSNNLIGDGSDTFSLVNGVDGNLVGTSANPIDPLLAEGSTYGIGLSPLPGSPAIDAGNNNLMPAGITTDVYGADPIQGARVNIGAVETTLPGMAAVTYVVTSLEDNVATDGVLTLREALAAANTNQAAGDAPAGSYSFADCIEFAPGLAGSIPTHGQAYSILGSVSVLGPGVDQLTLDAGGSGSVMEIRGSYDVRLGGLTLTGGRAAYGGGVYSVGARLQLDQVAIKGNVATTDGGGIYLSLGSLALTDVIFSGNTASAGRGGGMNQHYSTSTLIDATFSGNTASADGAGMYQRDGASTLTGVTFSGNTSRSGAGGGMARTNGTSTLSNVTITGNSASSGGGGVQLDYGTSTLTNVVINSNTARQGGGFGQYSGIATLTNVTISGNTATLDGGGICQSSATSALTNVTISGNVASGSGGGVWQSSTGFSVNNTIVANNVSGTNPDLYTSSGTLSGSHNLIGDGTGQTSLLNGVNGNLVGTSANPINPMLAEGTSLGIGLSPLPGSPAIDAGDDSLIPAGISTDVYGAARIQGARVNIGAVETVLQGTAGVMYLVTSLEDSVAADGVLTLREALAAANANQAAGDAPAGSYSSTDRIGFATGLTGTILTHGQAYTICGTVVITGPGSGQLALDGESSSGVLDIHGSYDVSISGMAITGGKAACGGGIYSVGIRLQLDDVAVVGNTASTSGGGIFQSCGSADMANVTISGNVAANYGGGIYQSSSASTLTNAVLSGNTSASGGGIAQRNGTLTGTRVTIIGNSASFSGGGIHQSSGTLTLTNVAISGNTASSSQAGGGVYLAYGTNVLTNVTISANQAPSGSGGGVWQSSNTSTWSNAIVASNVGGTYPDLYTNGGTHSGANNLIGNGTGQAFLTNGANGNLVGTSASPIDPQFVNISGSDWAQWDLHLRPTSPAVNAGSNAWIPAGINTDIAGGPRIVSGTVDMGAYEYNPAPTGVSLSQASIAENLPVGMAIGTFTTTDPDLGGSFIYTLVPGTGGDDNASFTISGNQLLTAASFDYEAKNSYSIRVRATDAAGQWFEKAFTITVTDLDEIVPAVTSVSINDSAAQRSMVRKLSVVFSEPVVLATGALQVKLQNGTLPPNTTISITNPSSDQKTYVLTFSGTAVIGGSLADGIYDLLVSASGVQDLAGNTLTADYSRRFHRLFGDSDGNKVVNSLDYARLKNTFGRAPADPLFNSSFDYEGNGLINALDLARFRQRYGLSSSY